MGARCSSLVSPKSPSYGDLPSEILDLVIAWLPEPADRACARAVSRSWHSAVRRHGPQPWRLPCVMAAVRRRGPIPWWLLSAMAAVCRIRRLALDADCVGSTNDWLAVRVGQEHKYLLHNPFFNKTVPLAELEAVIVHDESFIYKLLMRSGVDDFTAIITNNRMYAFMVIWPGKGVWLPQPWTRPYIDIVDFAFLQGKLYALTNADELIPFDLALDGEEKPVVTMGRRLIKQPHGPDVWPPEQQVAPTPNGTTIHNCSTYVGGPYNDPHLISRHLIESQGKLLMVRHHKKIRPDMRFGALYFTIRVEVFEADTYTGVWMPVTGGLGGGQALFISVNFSKSITAPCGEVEEDAIYFMGTGEVFDLKSGTCRPSRMCRNLGLCTWIFHPELVI